MPPAVSWFCLPARFVSAKADARAASDVYPGNAGEFVVISLPAGSRIWLVAGITDMRNGFNGLASRVQNTLRDAPFSGHLFISLAAGAAT